MSTRIRLVGPEDPCLADLAAIEDAGEALFAGHLDTSGWAPAPPGTERVGRPGFLLVAGDPAIGFAHVTDLDGHAHLEQLSVHPDHGRRGTGLALVRAVLHECARRGIASITLCTFAEIPWNGPFYTRLGFLEVEEVAAPGPVRQLRRREREAGLDRGGRRVVMRAAVATGSVAPRPAVSVIPLRDGPEGLEVFVQHRQSTMDFAAGAVVFPGGRCDPEDEAKGAALPLPEDVLAEHVHRWRRLRREGRGPAERARTLVATGVRELAEETGMHADPAALVPWDCWVTPPTSPKRFDVAFFVLHVPAAGPDQPSHRTSEATDSAWAPVERVLRDQEVGRLTLLTPTRVLLRELADLGDVATVLGRRPVVLGEVDDAPGARPRAGDAPRPG
ncbi:bifunctional GNAT family N-acetyltransferase/NUDIX hydrolase [Janibacter corallicola]|uniref:bifunctional GNAT family N-acetyltransferase/NUDIX hydrolase n=1 Tax=Janibacter corallicola TaxID=415212 RepID=UPI000A049EC2|nr:bifunctional GNAT family N-acetyltransferase/NUDIX hydrolase [Janibacter corallicola]